MSASHAGTVVAFDAAVGLGEVQRSDGRRFPFHCIELADGSRAIDVATEVTFVLLCKLGRYEAAGITRMNDRDRHITDVIRSLREGEVVTYGDIAEVAGYPRMSRLVGRILATTEDDLPWWRVVNAAGRLVPGQELEQAALLRAEGATVTDGRVRRAPTGRFSRSRS